jgi:hypothetical protein
MSTAPTAKLQPEQSSKADPAKTSETATATNTTAPNLEEDDEFEDFPVEGTVALHTQVL